MEQLTQMELLQIHELLSSEELTLKKCQYYAGSMEDDELQPCFQQAISLHKENLTTLVEIIKQHSGREVNK